MRDMVAEANAADTQYFRTVLPVVLDYVDHIAAADLDRLKRIAEHDKAMHELAVIQALIVARDAAQRVAEAAPVPQTFTVTAAGLCAAVVCTSLTNDEAAGRLNTAHPTGITSRWELADKPFPNGEPNP
ncbi:hypothetical protein, partial [Nonomuraea angiospora]|uniref:hypothetical protein n=1 Tax=Nonomuraea angiospora TaxID=46172 RepID=UPI0029BC18A0